MTTEVAELLCTCEHRQGVHDTFEGETQCQGFHQVGHEFADDTFYGPDHRGCRCEDFTLAGPPEPEPFAVPDGWVFKGLGTCRSCGQAIAWALTKNDKNAPINRDGSSHFATCPAADAWRHRGRR